MKLFSLLAVFPQVILLLAVSHRSTLKFSQVIFRHGDRNPRHTYGSYTQNLKKIWPEGLEELTDLGKNQAYELGQFLGERYNGFLSSSYISEEILVVSSHIHRCIKTASNCMLGIYRNFNDAATWTEDSEWVPPYEPIPIRSIPEEIDNLIALDANCPMRQHLRSLPWKAFFEQRFFQNETEILEYVFRNSGETALFESNKNSTKIHDEYYAVQEVINCLSFANKTLEDWMVPLLTNELFLSYPLFLQLAEYTESPLAQRLSAGALVELIVKNFAAHVNGTLKEKVVMFSGHDKNIVTIMFAFGIISALQNRIPPYASSLLMELHQYPDYDEPVIEFWYRKSTTKTLEWVDTPSCGIPCTLRNLQQVTSGLVDVDYEAECTVNL